MKKFHVSKLYLASQSANFKTLLCGGLKEANQAEVELNEIDPDAFQIFLKLIYMENTLTDSNVEEVLGLVDKYDAKNPACVYRQPYPEQRMMSEGVVLRSTEPTKKEKKRSSQSTIQQADGARARISTTSIGPGPRGAEAEKQETRNPAEQVPRDDSRAKERVQCEKNGAREKRRREEDEILVAVKKGNASAEMLERSERIKEKRRRNAEMAKLRYDSTTNSEKRKHNKGRSASRKTRTVGSRDSYGMEPYDESSNDYSKRGPSDTHNASYYEEEDGDANDNDESNSDDE